ELVEGVRDLLLWLRAPFFLGGDRHHARRHRVDDLAEQVVDLRGPGRVGLRAGPLTELDGAALGTRITPVFNVLGGGERKTQGEGEQEGAGAKRMAKREGHGGFLSGFGR